MYKVKDKFGRAWKYEDNEEYCPACKQPDNTGDCNCKKISKKQYNILQNKGE